MRTFFKKYQFNLIDNKNFVMRFNTFILLEEFNVMDWRRNYLFTTPGMFVFYTN